jgi:hypothetical protein
MNELPPSWFGMKDIRRHPERRLHSIRTCGPNELTLSIGFILVET